MVLWKKSLGDKAILEHDYVQICCYCLKELECNRLPLSFEKKVAFLLDPVFVNIMLWDGL